MRYSCRQPVVRLLRWYWVVLLVIGEIGLYYWRVSECKWPGYKEYEAAGVLPVHVALVADPQIVDHHSYGQTGALLRIVEFFTDIYVRKAYLVLQAIHRPQAVVFLGDLMDGGREWDDEQWMSEYARYKSIFRNRSPDSMRVYDMAGNHDIGIGNTVVQHALERFHSQVGPTNRIVTLADHQLVLLDTLTLESDTKTVSAASRRLVQQLAANNSDSKQTRLLFSHVPLWRPNGTYCGPLRQSAPGHLLNRRGYQFRDQLFENTTKYLLDSIRPAAVFSGDDHDTCTVDHPIASTGRQATEYTIGALGWASGVPVASYGLLTLYPRGVGRSQPPVHAVQNCFLPYQLGIYKVYALSFIASLLLAAASCYSGARSWRPTLCKPSDDYELLVDHGGDQQQQQPYALVPRQDTDDQAQEMSLPMPGTTTATTPGKWTLNQRGYAVRVATTVRSVAVVAVPVYIASILYFYIV